MQGKERGLGRLRGLTSLFFSNKSDKQVVFKNTFWLGTAQGLYGLLNFLLSIYVIRVFGPTEYGKFAFAFSFASLFSTFFDFGLSTTITREFARDKNQERHFIDLFALKLLLGIVVVVAIVFIAFLITDDPYIRRLIYILGIYILTLEAVNFFYATFRARKKMEVEAIFRILQIAIFAGLVILVIYTKPTILILSLSYLGATLVTLVLIFLYSFFIDRDQLTLRPSFNFAICKKFFIIGWYLALSKGVGDIILYTDSITLGYWGMIEETGFYNAALRLNRLALFPTALAATAIFPTLVTILTNSEQRFLKYWKAWFKGTVFVALFLFFIVMAKAEDIIIFTYSSEFMPAVPVFKILVVMTMVVYINALYYNILLIFDHQKKIFFAVLFGAILNVVLNLLLIPIFGITGAAIATVFTQLVYLSMCIYYTSKHTWVRPFYPGLYRAVIAAFIAGIVIYIALILLDTQTLGSLLITLAGGFAVYTAIFYIMNKVLGVIPYLASDNEN